ncbi:MAG: ABC transporter ATP-binding protein [Alphaproteobacteria bacterium]
MSEAPVPAIGLKGATKHFPGVVANDAITLDFLPGEVHVLLGENGAGKSTLIALLAGMQQPDDGSIEIAGEPMRIASPRDSLRHGIGTVFQHVLLVPSLTVIENLMLGGGWWRGLDRVAALKRFRDLAGMLGVDVDPDAPVGRLELGQQQQVEIIRALWRDARVLILDEPTSMLTPQGVADLGEVMERLKARGVAVIFITHKLREAYAFGDRISVLRLGKLVGVLAPERLRTMSEADVTDEVIRLMFGQTKGHGDEAEALLGRGRHAPRPPVARHGRPRLELIGVSTLAAPGECALTEISLSLWPGEVLGVAGVDGNGQKHLAEVLAGQRPAAAGRILIDGEDVAREGVAARRRRGLSYVTDERLAEGSVASLSVATNLVLKEIGKPPLWRRGMTLWDRVHARAREQVARHDIRTPSERTPLGRLSGGNIQKVLLARELGEGARIAVFNKPTYGLDLHNTSLARQRIRDSAARGMATFVISTELDELFDVSDRVAVLFQGRLVGIVDNAGDIERRVGRMMTGAAA